MKGKFCVGDAIGTMWWDFIKIQKFWRMVHQKICNLKILAEIV